MGKGPRTVRARYLLTKLRPGNDGSWESELASQMVPWREVFNLEELTFDELLQRDLDDSRVAHDLIPYLLGETPAKAHFFPPILAVIVPRKLAGGTGIERLYPGYRRDAAPGRHVESFGDLFEFEQLHWDGQPTPLASIRYNRQRSAFVIADGQHRAMAVLALHRQLTDSWGSNPFAGYYSHISITQEQVKSIELPVCIVFFPDLHPGTELAELGIDLHGVCREIFVVVNRNAKRVSRIRELLLDDDDFAARLMRSTLSKLKGRGELEAGKARVYSFDYGDSDETKGGQVVNGHFLIASALALYKLHSAICFGRAQALNWTSSIDISDARNARNPERPATLLLGTRHEHLPALSRDSAADFLPADAEDIVHLLSELGDSVILRLFDGFRPFEAHNTEFRALRTRLSDVNARANQIQAKCYSLIFEGSGTRNVFDAHLAKLREARNEQRRELGEHLKSQLLYAESVEAALFEHEKDFIQRRACRLFSVDHDAFFESSDVSQQQRQILQDVARGIYTSVATQAFQLGFAMAILSTVESMLPPDAPYAARKLCMERVTELYLACMNHYFAPESDTLHRTLKGFVTSDRARVFDIQKLGLRGLLAMNGIELNEKRWDFFRYAVLEIVHSPFCDAARRKMLQSTASELQPAYASVLPSLIDAIQELRAKYIEGAVQERLKDAEVRNQSLKAELKAQSLGASPEEAKKEVEKYLLQMRASATEMAREHLKASLGPLEDGPAMLERLRGPAEPPAAIQSGSPAASPGLPAEKGASNPAGSTSNVEPG